MAVSLAKCTGERKPQGQPQGSYEGTVHNHRLGGRCAESPIRSREPGPSGRALCHNQAVQYGPLVVAAALAFGLVVVARARRRDQQDRDELRAHVRRLGGPSDPGM